MRAMLGIAISLPIAAIFCLVYLTALVLEGLRDAAFSRPSARRVRLQKEPWSGPARIAA